MSGREVDEEVRMNFAFTIHDPVFEGPNVDIFTFVEWEWCIYQLEKCPETQKLHYQCAGRLKKRSTMKHMTSKFKIFKGQIKPMIAAISVNKIYCTKEESRIAGPWELGEMPEVRQGARKDLSAAIEASKDYDIFEDYVKAFPEVYFKYHKAMNNYWKMTLKKEPPMDLILRPWQKNVVTMCEREPDDRKVFWFFDEKGGAGKTMLGRYLLRNCDAFYWTNSKNADFAYAYEGQRIVVFDFTRTLEEHVNYSLLEAVKNGMIVSTKYESVLKNYKSPWLLVFANFQPNVHKMSEDRWQIINDFN